MKTLLKLAASSSILAMLLGCSGASGGGGLEALRNIDSSGASAFNQALSADYATYAVWEFETEAEAEFISEGEGEVELKDFALFVRKAISAGKNERVEPENVSDWSIPSDRATVLNEHRTLMMEKFAKGGKESHPELAGHAQGQFDCWVEEEAEGHENPECMVKHKAAIAGIGLP